MYYVRLYCVLCPKYDSIAMFPTAVHAIHGRFKSVLLNRAQSENTNPVLSNMC
jgi:hypothetical protein